MKALSIAPVRRLKQASEAIIKHRHYYPFIQLPANETLQVADEIIRLRHELARAKWELRKREICPACFACIAGPFRKEGE